MKNPCLKISGVLLGLLLAATAPAQTTGKNVAPEAEQGDEAQLEKLRREAERARLEAELAKARAEKAKAEAERTRAEAEQARARAELRRARGQRQRRPRLRRRRPAYRHPWQPPPPPGPPPGAFTHDGFFLRLSLGPGFGGYTSTGHVLLEDSGLLLTAPGENGLIGGGTISLGGSLGAGFILHGDLWGAIQMVDDSYDSLRRVALGVVGIGVTYYFMPVNIYLTGSLGFATAQAEGGAKLQGDYFYHSPDVNQHLGSGVAFSLGCGKEWWVSANWGVGMAISGFFAYSEGDDFVLRQGGMQLLFSATFN